MSALLPLHHTVAMVTAHHLLDHNDHHSKECRDKAQTILRQLQSNLYTAVSKDVLEQFVVKYPKELTGELLCALVPPHLKSLTLKNCQKLLDEGLVTDYQYLDTVLQRCSKLQSLTLDDCNLHSSLDLCTSITNHASGLSSVSLENCLGVNDEMVQSLIRGIPALKYLNLSLIQNVTDKVFALEKKQDDSSSTPGSHLAGVDLAGCRQLSSSCIRHLTDLCGPSLQSLNVANTGMDCTILWYLSGYSLSTAGQLALLANKDLKGEDTMQGTQLIELLKDLQYLQQKMRETVQMLAGNEELSRKERNEEASLDGGVEKTSGNEVHQGSLQNLEKHQSEEAVDVIEGSELVLKDQRVDEKCADAEDSAGSTQEKCKQLMRTIDNVMVLIEDTCGQSPPSGHDLAKADEDDQHEQEGQSLQQECSKLVGVVDDAKTLLAEKSDEGGKVVGMADNGEEQLQLQSLDEDTNVMVSHSGRKEGDVSELDSHQDKATINMLVNSNDVRIGGEKSDSGDALPSPADMFEEGNSNGSELRGNPVGYSADAATSGCERTKISVIAHPSLLSHEDGMNEYLIHHRPNGSNVEERSQDQSVGEEALSVSNQDVTADDKAPKVSNQDITADSVLDEKSSDVLQGNRDKSAISSCSSSQDEMSNSHKMSGNVKSDDLTKISEELVQTVLAKSIQCLQEEIMNTSGLTKSMPSGADVVELNEISLDVSQSDGLRSSAAQHLEKSIPPCLSVVDRTLSSSGSQRTSNEDVPPIDKPPPDASMDDTKNHNVLNIETMERPHPDPKCGSSASDVSPIPSAIQSTMQNVQSGKVSGAADQGQPGGTNSKNTQQVDHKSVLRRLYQPKIMSLDISNIKFDETLARTCLQEFFVANEELKKLTLSWNELQDSILEIIAKASSQLQYLALYECEGITSQGLAHLLTHCPELQVLNLQGACFIADFALLPLFMKGERGKVTSLQLSETNITNSSLTYIAKYLGSKLTSLELSWCEEITEAGLADIASKCSSLEVFHARQGKISGDSLVELTHNCTRLTCLNLSSVDGLTDSVVVEMARNMHHIKVLDLSWNLALTDDSVSAVLCNCSLMTEFNMAGLKRTTEKPLLPIVADFDRWRRCMALIQLKMRERRVLRDSGDPQLSSDEEYEDLYVPVRSTSYVPHLNYLDVQYCDRMKDKVLAQIVAICRGTLTIKDYYGEDIIPKLLGQ